MAASTHTAGSNSRQSITTSGPFIGAVSSSAAAVARFGGKVLRGINTFIFNLQTARMMSTLAELSDHQLAQIGISRSDIPKYAETLMEKD